MTPDYDDTIAHPLATDDLIEERVAALVGRACRRQLWFLFLDANSVQLPLIMPIADPPPTPDDSIGRLAGLIAEKVDDSGASSVIVVIERYAEATFSHSDKLWARALTEELDAIDIAVRSVMISHRSGVRWFAQDDYRFDSTASSAR